jgi:hypothetical protein
MATLVVHPGGWSRWTSSSLLVGPTRGSSLTPETFFWGTPRVGQGLFRVGHLEGALVGPTRGGALLVWNPTPGFFVGGGNPVQTWLTRLAKLLGYL